MHAYYSAGVSKGGGKDLALIAVLEVLEEASFQHRRNIAICLFSVFHPSLSFFIRDGGLGACLLL